MMQDRNGLKARLKNLDKTLVTQGRETGALEEIAAAMLDAIATENRQPDAWEANCLLAAFDALRKHRFGLARANLLHALETVRHLTPTPRSGSDLESLRKSLAQLQALPPKGIVKLHSGSALHLA